MNTLERKLPIGIQTFEDIRRGNYLYVDKTSILWQIINTGKPYFCLLYTSPSPRDSCASRMPSSA